MKFIRAAAASGTVVAAMTCSFTVDGPYGGSCDIPGVKAPCCDLVQMQANCKNHNQLPKPQPMRLYNQEGLEMCLHEQKHRIIEDTTAAGGSCPGLLHAMHHKEKYCKLAASETHPAQVVPDYKVETHEGSGAGHFIEQHVDVTANDCAKLCNALPKCRAFTYFPARHTCKLKSALGDQQKGGNRDTYIKDDAEEEAITFIKSDGSAMPGSTFLAVDELLEMFNMTNVAPRENMATFLTSEDEVIEDAADVTEDDATEDDAPIVTGILGFLAGATFTVLGLTVLRRSSPSPKDQYNEIVA